MFTYTRYNEPGMNQLLGKAESRYNHLRPVLCKYLYRNKSSNYFEKIINDKDFIMEPYVKDGGGDRYNPINKKLHGLFFYASVEHGSTTGTPQPYSFFGNTRFLVPVELLIDRSTMNLYFSDFFCLQSTFHYTTLVVTTAGSQADIRCCHSWGLPKLSWTDNPFFFFDQTSMTYRVPDSIDNLVEIFYTDAINIAEKMNDGATLIGPMPTSGTGSSKAGGLKKNILCSICNFQGCNNDIFHSQLPFVETFNSDGVKSSGYPKSEVNFKFGRMLNREYRFNPNPNPDEHYITTS